MDTSAALQSDLDDDFDHLDPIWINNPYPIWDEMRQNCPVAHTDKFNGVYFPSRYTDVRAIAYDSEHFSSRRVVVRADPPEFPPFSHRSRQIHRSIARIASCCCLPLRRMPSGATSRTPVLSAMS